MFLLATSRKYQLIMKRNALINLLTKIQLSNHGTNQSTNGDSHSVSMEGTNSLDKPPVKPEVGECCGSGCQNCVWFKYVAEIRFYYGIDKDKLREALNSIPEPDIKAFVEMQLKKAIKFDI